MTPDEFVDVVHGLVYRAAVNDVVASLSEVPRGADATQRDASAWYNGLPADSRMHVRVVAELAAHHALFGREKGEFVLAYRKGGVETALNPPRGEMLHDLLNDAIARVRESSSG